MKSKGFRLLILGVFVLTNQLVYSQCSMCRAVVESDISGKGSGINNGIVYLMSFPYMLVGLLAIGLIYKMRKDAQ